MATGSHLSVEQWLPQDRVAFRYETSVETFVDEQPFDAKRMRGTIPRRWI